MASCNLYLHLYLYLSAVFINSATCLRLSLSN